MKRTILIALISFTVQAQQLDYVVKVVEVKNAPACALMGLLQPPPMSTEERLEVQKRDPHFSCDSQRNIITVSGWPQRVEQAVAAIPFLDKPIALPKRAELTIYLLAGRETAGPSVPSELAPVVDQLKKLFPYAAYQLIEANMVPIEERKQSQIKSQFEIDNQTQRYDLGFSRWEFTGAPAKITTDISFEYGSAALRAPVALEPGKQVIVGKAAAGKDAIFLVLSARMLP
jgi:hypothetical protein